MLLPWNQPARLTRLVFAALIAALLLTSCVLPGVPGFSPAPAGTEVAAENATPSAPVDTPAPTVTPYGQQPENPAQPAAIMQGGLDPSQPLSDLVLFTSTQPDPFTRLVDGGAQPAQAERYLWAVSPDGRRAGRLSPEGQGTALFVPTKPDVKIKYVQNGVTLEGDRFTAVPLPPGCDEKSCGGYQFSPDGSLLAYYTAAGECARPLVLLNLATRKPLATWPNATWYAFFKDGGMLVTLGDCEKQNAYLYLPGKGTQAGIDQLGKAFWNQDHTAVVFQVAKKPAPKTALWGFNLETSQVFLWAAQENVIEDSVTWLADGKQFVYQRRDFQYDDQSQDALTTGPRQIILMNAWTRQQRLLAFDGAYDYHLCQSAGEPCEQPFGEWLEAWRNPYQPVRFKAAGSLDDEKIQCGLYGLQCPEPPERWALNTQTLKGYAWDKARVPEAQPTPEMGALLPDFEQETPLYKDEAASTALYTGLNQRSLWFYPPNREARLWVYEGEGFFYLK